MNSLTSTERIKQEFRNLSDHPIGNMGIFPGLLEDNDYYRWIISILGPKETPYEKSLFYAEVIFPKLYPEQAPKIIFITPIYHPNVNMRKSSINFPLGQVAFKLINFWKPSYTIREVLTKLYSFFYYPNLDLAYSLEIAKEYKENKDLFEKKAKYFSKKYANFFCNSRKKYEYWDFSGNDNYFNSLNIKQKEQTINNKNYEDYDGNQLITLNFEINGIMETKVNCKLNELIKDVIEKVLNQNGINVKKDILVILNSQKINLDFTLGAYHIKDNFKLTIIYDI